MSLIATCPTCARTGNVPDTYRGRRVVCRQCGTGFVVPAADSRSESLTNGRQRPPAAAEPPGCVGYSGLAPVPVSFGFIGEPENSSAPPISGEGLTEPTTAARRPGVRLDTAVVIGAGARKATRQSLSIPAIPCAAPAMKASLWVALALLFAVSPAAADDAKPREVASPAKVKPGTTGLLKSAGKGMRYFLRVPRRYDPRAGARLIVFLHGSNMNGLDYLRSFEAKKWCEDDLLCCPNGEQGTDPFGANNFTFVSAPLVADVTEEVQKAFKTTVTYVGGHSQGGFLTYSVIMHYPDLYRGAFPMAGDCWMQNEPNLWEDKPEVMKKHKEIAIAVIHGRADPVVDFSQGEHAYDCFRAMGWTKLRLFAPKQLNHAFMLSPVDEALDWLDAMNGRNEKKSLGLAAKWAKEGEWGWVWHAARASKKGGALQRSAEDAAAKAVPAMTKALQGKPADWVPKWVEFWRVYGATKAAQPLVADYLKQRGEQRAAAVRLFNESQALFRSNKRDDGLKVLEKLRDQCPYTYQGFFASAWLAAKP
jgi:poly(3-hydroxybutyrate) depolymerase